MTDNAAALTYYALLSLFPALLFGVAVLGVFGQQGLDRRRGAATCATRARRQTTVDAVTGALSSRAGAARTAAIGALVVGLATSLYGASGAFGAVGRALNKIWRVEEGRGVRRAARRADLDLDAAGARARARHVRPVFLGGELAARRPRQRSASARSPAGLWLYRALARRAGDDDADLRDRLLRRAERRGAHASAGSRPGAAIGVAASGCSRRRCSSSTSRTSAPTTATYGAFAGAVILLVWLWLTQRRAAVRRRAQRGDRSGARPSYRRSLRRAAAAGQGAGRRPELSPVRRRACAPRPRAQRAPPRAGRRTARGAGCRSA